MKRTLSRCAAVAAVTLAMVAIVLVATGRAITPLVPVDLGTLFGGSSIATAISNNGMVVGQSILPGSATITVDSSGTITVPVSTFEIVVEDIFGRRLNEHGILLVDWEGYMANPAIKFFVVPPQNAAFPATAIITADNARLYFDLPSQVGAAGPSKSITFADAFARVPVLISNAPDRDTSNGHHHLTVQFTGNDNQQMSLVIDVHEIDQDQTAPGPYAITADFSQDQTGFYSDPVKAAIVQQAAADYAYFVGDMQLDPVAAGSETTFIWDKDSFNSGHFVTNSQGYTGFLLYAYGIHTAALRSGGEPSSAGGFQSSGGVGLPLRRSGGYESETQGNFNTLGWFLTANDNDWWVSQNFGNEPNDLYSIGHHEMGHAFIFNPAQPNFGQFKQLGFVEDAAVLAYHGSYPRIDGFDHMNGAIDRASRRGAFGYEYFGDVPRRRWLITKLDLLVAQAIGYTLRQTSAFVPLSISTTTLINGKVPWPYAATLQAVGGIPFYNWTIASGSLPDGLSLNTYTGGISGWPTTPGTFNFTVRVQEYVEGSPGVTVPLTITVDEGRPRRVQ
jgi:hypothetical protein